MADALARDLPRIKNAGTLRFFGVWFGRPMDNLHRIVSCVAEGAVLRLGFEHGEQLSIWSPRGLEADAKRFRIAEAAQVRWEWTAFGQPRAERHRQFMEFRSEAGAVTLATNRPGPLPAERPSAACPAVELH